MKHIKQALFLTATLFVDCKHIYAASYFDEMESGISLNHLTEKKTPKLATHRESSRQHATIVAPQCVIEAPQIIDDFIDISNACKEGILEDVQNYIKNGNDVNARAEFGYPLILSASYGHFEIVKLLLENGANTEKKDHFDRTALHWACNYGYKNIIKILIAYHANLDAVAKGNMTPLHFACNMNDYETAAILSQNGASLTPTNEDGYTALSYISNHPIWKIIQTQQNSFFGHLLK